MRLHAFFRFIVIAVAACIAAAAASALDLPVKKIKGQQYYIYKVKNKESVYGVAKHLGISREDIVRHNPQAADGLSKNMTLYFPVAEFGLAAETPAPDTVAVVADTLPPVNDFAKIALILPFGLDSDTPTRQNELYRDFYKGFLVGADTLSNLAGKTMEIRAFDAPATPSALAKLLETEPFFAQTTVFVAPDDENTIAALAAKAETTGAHVLNLFNVRDTAYHSHKALLQANTPAEKMYELAAEALLARYEGFVPVILRNTAGRNEKQPFIDYILPLYADRGIEPVTVEYDGTLHASVLNDLPADDGTKYVVIPTTGALAEFNRYAHIVRNWRDRLLAVAAENPENTAAAQVEIFGYPDWTAFRGEALDMLHRLGATVYSRFLDDFTAYPSESFAASFRRWYGTEMIESVPTQALLGFDAACFLIKNLRANDGTFEPTSPASYRGIQSAFRFVPAGEGYANSTLYIIHYGPGGRQSARVL